MKSLWQTLPKPILVLAPMEDVTDTVFRRIVASIARPTIFFTEFTSVDGLFSRGRGAVIHRFDYAAQERPIIAQVWGNKPELFYKAAQLVAEMKFDGIDINAGCPEKNVISHGGGACLINDHTLMKEIIQATQEGAAQGALPGGRLPISVKTRIGYKKIDTEEWMSFLLSCDLDALTVHGRTAAELSKVPAHWDEIAKAVRLRNVMGKKTIVLGNGDVVDYADAVAKCKKFGTDGAMIGRGIFHNLWAFDPKGISHMDDHKELLRIMREHIRLFGTTWGTSKNFAVLKKFFKIYVQGFDNASQARERLMEAANLDQVEGILREITL